MSDKEFIIPSQIPWDSLKGKSLEELVYWLLYSMGAKNLNWRIGGVNGGASDQGRDLECSFYLQSPDGNLEEKNGGLKSKGAKKQ